MPFMFSTLFGRWQQRCGLLLSVLQQLVCASGFKVLRIADIDRHAENISKVSQTVVDDFAACATVSLSSHPKFISLSSDSLTLSVCFRDQLANIVYLYDIRSFKGPVILAVSEFLKTLKLF